MPKRLIHRPVASTPIQGKRLIHRPIGSRLGEGVITAPTPAAVVSPDDRFGQEGSPLYGPSYDPNEAPQKKSRSLWGSVTHEVTKATRPVTKPVLRVMEQSPATLYQGAIQAIPGKQPGERQGWEGELNPLKTGQYWQRDVEAYREAELPKVKVGGTTLLDTKTVTSTALSPDLYLPGWGVVKAGTTPLRAMQQATRQGLKQAGKTATTKGNIRLYRGIPGMIKEDVTQQEWEQMRRSGGTYESRGEWFTSSLESGKHYANTPESGELFFIDIPRDVAQRYSAGRIGGITGEGKGLGSFESGEYKIPKAVQRKYGGLKQAGKQSAATTWGKKEAAKAAIRQRAGGGVETTAGTVNTWIQSHLADRFAFGNKSQRRVVKSGAKITPDMDFETKAALMGSAAERGNQIYKETIAEVEKALRTEVPVPEGRWRPVRQGEAATLGRATKDIPGTNRQSVWETTEEAAARATATASADTVNEYLLLKHAHEVFMMKGSREVVGTVKGPVEAVQKLGALEESLGPRELAKVKVAADIVRNNYETQMAAMVQEGLVDPQVAQFLRTNYPWYNTIKYMDEVLAHSEGVSKVISSSDNGLRKLGEIGAEGELIDPLNTLRLSNLKTETLIAKNQTARAAVKIFQADPQLSARVRILAEGETKANNMGTISYLEGGKKITLEVPKEVEDFAKQLNAIPKVDTFRIAGAINAVSRAGTTGLNIAFFVPNMAVDTLTALITQGVGPLAVSRRIAANLKGIIKDDPVMARYLKAKGGMSGFWGKSAEEMAREASKAGNLVLRDERDFKYFMAEPFRKIAQVGHAIEMGPRVAVFEKQLAKGATEEAGILAARRATIDFNRSGTLIRELNSMFLYLNAGVQGTMVPFRAMRDLPMARLRATGFMGLVAANYAYNRQFEEYADVPNYYKFGSGLLFMVPSNDYDKRGNKIPHFITLIPNQREWSLFSAPISYALSKLDGQNPEDFDQFIAELVPRVNPLTQFTGQGGLPIPTQAGETLVSALIVNKDFFSGRDIVPVDLQGLPAEEQYDEFTSSAAINAGRVLGVSPKKLDYIVKGIFGGVGGQALEAFSWANSKIAPTSPDERIEGMVEKLEDIQKTVEPEKIETERNKYLFSLSDADRQAVLDLERHPSERMPIVTNISRRVYHEGGGQLYQTGLALAAKKTGVSKSQSQQASILLGKYSAELQGAQEKLDALLGEDKITRPQWRELHKELGKQYQGALGMVKAMYPRAAQASDADYQNWLTNIYTLGGSMPDIRSRVNVLESAYRAITPEGEPGLEDWDGYFAKQTAFMNGLIPEDRAALTNELQAKMTVVEKEYARATELLRPYWDIERNVYDEYENKMGSQGIKAAKKSYDDRLTQLRNQPMDARVRAYEERKLQYQYAPRVTRNGRVTLMDQLIDYQKQLWKRDPKNREAVMALGSWYAR